MFIYLASKSPRRAELLKQFGIAFKLNLFEPTTEQAEDVDETPLPNEPAADYVCRITRQKAEAGYGRVIQRKLPRAPVLAADTTIAFKGHIIGKPSDQADAFNILRQLSGQTHTVLTALCLQDETRQILRLNQSNVQFCTLSDTEIKHYIQSGEPMDKAGAYGIQGHAAAFVQSIQGSYTGIMGLPLFELNQILSSYNGPA